MTSEPDQIRSNIEQTQQELSTDVDALTEKLSPQRIVERRVRGTRSAMTNVKDKIMGSTSDGISTSRDTGVSGTSSMSGTVSSKASAARDTLASTASSAADAASSAPDMARRRAQGNPLAAGLIAFGAGWLISSLPSATEPEQQVAAQVKEVATEKGRPIAQQLGEAGQQTAEQLRESAQQKAESVKQTAVDAASTVADDAQSTAGDATSRAQEAKDRVTEQARPRPSGS